MVVVAANCAAPYMVGQLRHVAVLYLLGRYWNTYAITICDMRLSGFLRARIKVERVRLRLISWAEETLFTIYADQFCKTLMHETCRLLYAIDRKVKCQVTYELPSCLKNLKLILYAQFSNPFGLNLCWGGQVLTCTEAPDPIKAQEGTYYRSQLIQRCHFVSTLRTRVGVFSSQQVLRFRAAKTEVHKLGREERSQAGGQVLKWLPLS